MELITPTLIVSPPEGGTLTIEQAFGRYEGSSFPQQTCDYATNSYIAKPADGWSFSEFWVTQKMIKEWVRNGLVEESQEEVYATERVVAEDQITMRADGSFVWSAAIQDLSMWWSEERLGVPYYGTTTYSSLPGWENSQDFREYTTEITVTAVFVMSGGEIVKVPLLVVDKSSRKLVRSGGLLLNGM